MSETPVTVENAETVKLAPLNSFVTYLSSKGDRKSALVIGTPDSITPGTSVPVPAENERHLLVFSPTGAAYAKHSVPMATPDYDTNEDARSTNIWL